VQDIVRDEHGHLSLGKMDLAKLMAEVVARRFEERTRSHPGISVPRSETASEDGRA
jgi:hypothetical protein